MKDSQWTVAVIVLAALVFVAVFVGQYLGSGPPSPASPGAPGREAADVELTFTSKTMPTAVVLPPEATGGEPREMLLPLEVEEKEKGHQDFYFLNHNESPV